MMKYIAGHPLAKCSECKRVFDMLNDLDVEEWSFGHDCEVI